MEAAVKNKLDAPMPWIGMYIATASVACTIALTLDAINACRLKKLWLPCNYFSLNSFSLTLLAVVVKLPLDLTGTTFRINEKLARISSLALVSTCMANFMPSLGSMENTDIVLNVAALGILVITVAVNVLIHNLQMSYFERTSLAEEVVLTVLMLLLLVNICSMAIMIPSTKRDIESKYEKMHHTFQYERIDIEEALRRYWVMAATSSPQFVMVRSAISATSGLVCLSMALILVEAHARVRSAYDYRRLNVYSRITSNYGWSIDWILYVQSVGVALGTIAPLLRWCVAAWFKLVEVRQKKLKEELKIETYWTSKLAEGRESSVSVHIKHVKCRKLLHAAKRLILNICVGFQFLFVVTSKLVLRLFAFCGGATLWCFHNIKIFKRCDPNQTVGSEWAGATQFVMLLEGETQLPKRILKNICNEVDEMIQMGERTQPKNLIQLLHKSVNFKGVIDFDSDEIPSLLYPDPPNCWSLSVVTLTSIALALPNITDFEAKQLLSRVSEGLSLVNLIQKTLHKNRRVENIHDAANRVWVGVELYRKWQDNDLRNIGTTRMEILQKLSSIAEKTITDLLANGILMQNPLYWPVKLIAANSMYRLTQTLLLAHKIDETNEDVFDRLSVIISDILAACLTNIAHVIRLKCHKSGIKEREDSVREAATLLGQSRQILEFLEQCHGLAQSMDAENAADIDNWRAYLQEQNSEDP